MIFKRTLFKLEEVPFVMELPPYRVPTFKSTMIHMWGKGSQYLKKMGGIILISSILIWSLSYFPREVSFSKDYNGLITQVESSYSSGIENNSEENQSTSIEEKESKIAQIRLEMESERFERSYIGQMGHFIEPILRPLNFDWKLGVSLITGIAAKEIVVSTMGVLYQTNTQTNETSASLIEKLQAHVYADGERAGEKVFTPLVAYSFMLFILIYFPCIAVIAAIKNESGEWKWALFAMGYTTGLAYTVSLLVHQIGSLFI